MDAAVHAEFVGHGRQVWQQLRKGVSRLPKLFELELGPQQFGVPTQECKPLSFQILIRAEFTIMFLQDRFVVKQVEMRRRPDHVKKNHILGLGQ